MSSIIKVDTIQTAAGGTPTAGDLGLNTTGTELQVVSVSDTTSTAITSVDTYIDSGLQLSITPSSTSSKILLIVDLAGQRKNSEETIVRILQTAPTSSTVFERSQGYSETTSWTSNYLGCSVMLSPSTTSQLTYKYQVRKGNNELFQISPTASGITNLSSNNFIAMEIAG